VVNHESRVDIVNLEVPKQHAAFALIAIGQGPMRQFLLQWNQRWGAFNLIGGKQDPHCETDTASLSRTIQRELEEEMGLCASTDFQIMQQLGLVTMTQYSRREQQVKEYTFAIFDVRIFPTFPVNFRRNSAIRWLSTGDENVFVSANEINNLMTQDGRPISTTTKYILQAVGELPCICPPMAIVPPQHPLET
jgi:8-oxo-dGTP pyrophosphatase MutT (NUDIX family)